MKIAIEEKTVDEILNYLAGKPWNEVNPYIVPLIQAKRSSEPAKEEPKEGGKK